MVNGQSNAQEPRLPVSHQAILQQARQGEASAIAWLIDQALSTRGVSVRAVCKDGCLHVLLEAESVPDAAYGRVVYAAVLCLGVPAINTLRVYGRRNGQNSPDWTQAFLLSQELGHLAALLEQSESQPEVGQGIEQPLVASDLIQLAPEQAVSTVSRNSTSKNSTHSIQPEQAEPEPDTVSPVTTSEIDQKTIEQKPWRSKVVALRSSSSLPIALSICAGVVGLGTGFRYLNLLKSAPEEPTTKQTSEAIAASSVPSSPGLATAALVAPSVVPSVAPTVQSPLSSPRVSPQAASPQAASPQSEMPGEGVPGEGVPGEIAVTLKAVGDMIPGSNYSGKANLPTTPGEALAAEREFLFGNIKPFFGDADILFGNFESTLTDHPYSAKDTSQNMTFAFRTPPVYAQMLQELGFDVLSVANNHSMDFGDQGFADTIAHIQQTGMKAVGQKGEIVYTTANNVTVAFIGFSYLPDHNQMQDLAAAGALIQEAKKQAQVVVVSVHAGAEGSDQTHVSNQTEYFFGEDRGNLVQFSRTMVDQGADLILGHGPHVPRAVELYQGRLIAYSLGNFIGYQTLSSVGTLGNSLILNVQMDREGKLVGGRIIPVALNSEGVPKLDDYFQSVVLIRNLTRQDFPETPLVIDDMGYLVPTNR